MKKRARVHITLELLRRILKLDDTIRICAVAQTSENLCRDEVTLILSGEGLHEDFVETEGNMSHLGTLQTTSTVDAIRSSPTYMERVVETKVIP